ncbi:hypothetical protein LCGC14_2640570 [marine sediment metagenome]|uniref:Uncharacterized protein n=1 Tax=marine sediment metagenome TaxID=412755 RepID=A0A0F9C8C5_9ZZZZ
MTNKGGHATKDPLAGIKPVMYASINRRHKLQGWSDSPGIDRVALLPEPAVRKAMVEWLRGERAKWLRVENRQAEEVLLDLADRLEAGGGER